MTLSRNQVLQALRTKGPSVPAELTSTLKGDTYLVGAFLSELVANQDVKITSAKVGGSPLYYVPAHASRIVRLRTHLHEKERAAFDLLSEKLVLRDDEQSPLIRTCLRNLKDFALPVTVRFGSKELLFWRWFLTDTSAAQEKIRTFLEPPVKEQSATKPAQESTPVEEKPKASPQVTKPKPVVKEAKLATAQPTLFTADEKLAADPLYIHVVSQFTTNNIEVTAATLVRAKNEIDGQVLVPTPIGAQRYYFKARKKKTCNEKDVSAALLQAHKEGLPLLFILTGSLTKKAQKLQETDLKAVLFLTEIGDP